MWRLILLTFGGLGWLFYELSGGADYHPPVRAEITDPKPTLAMPDTVGTTSIAAFRTSDETSEGIADTSAAALPPVAVARPMDDAVILASLPAQVADQPMTIADIPAAPSVAGPAPEAKPLAPELDIRAVAAVRVNMRNGPGTRFAVLSKLTQGTRVEVLRNSGEGWVKLKVLNSGRVGWIAERLLVDAN